jgi:hypothetical protein
MKLPTESKMKTWYEELERVRKLNTVSPAENPTPDFAWINTDQTGPLPNPYKQYDDEDTDDEDMMSHAGGVLPPVRSLLPIFPTGNKDRPGGTWF